MKGSITSPFIQIDIKILGLNIVPLLNNISDGTRSHMEYNILF